MRYMFKLSRAKFLAAILIAAISLSACGGPGGAATTPTSITQAQPSPGGTAAPQDQPTVIPTEAVSDSTPASKAISGKLVLYTARTESLIKPVTDAFMQANPSVEVVLLTGANAELAARMLEERSSPQADFFINTDIISMASLAEQGLFAPNTLPSAMSVPEAYRAEDGTWVALTLRARVIMYNTNLVKQEDLPKSVFDLTDPKWKGQVGSSNSTNGSMQGQIVAMRHLLGEQKTEEFIRGLVANDTKFYGGHTDVRKAVGTGELKLGLVNHYYYQLSKAEGAPVGIVYPDQGQGDMGLLVNSTNGAIIKGGPNPVVAQAFMDFLLTEEGQKLFAELNYEYPIVEGVPLPDGVQPLDQFRLADITLKTLAAEIEPSKALMEKAGLP
jgi:iron(III) transport system substrate-binding protein